MNDEYDNRFREDEYSRGRPPEGRPDDVPEELEDDFFIEALQDEHLPQPEPAYPTAQPSIQYTTVTCVGCGYNLSGATVGGVCPECGAQVDQSLYAAEHIRANGKAITSMVLGICSVPSFCCCPVSGILAVLGLVFGIIAMTEISNGGYTPGSRGMAIAGLSTSGVALALGLLFIIL